MGFSITDGVSLKSRTLKNILQHKGLKQSQLAQQMGISDRAFTHKLYFRQKFSHNELKALIGLIGVKAAIKVIWFPTLEEKKRIEQYVWEGLK